MHHRSILATLTLAAGVLTAGNAAAVTVELTASQDATIYSNATSFANGTGINFLAGNNGNGQTRRALLQFDLSSIAPGSTVTSAVLELYMDQTPSATARSIGLHAIDESWTEGPADPGGQQGQGIAAGAGDVTWVSRSHPSTLWTTAGGAFGAASATLNVGAVGSYAWDSGAAGNAGMLTDVQSWIDAPGGNFGWMLVGAESGTSTVKRFISSEGDASLVPVLRLEIVPVPEPSTHALVVAGLALVAGAARRESRRMPAIG